VSLARVVVYCGPCSMVRAHFGSQWSQRPSCIFPPPRHYDHSIQPWMPVLIQTTAIMPPRLRLSPTVTLLPLRCRPAGAQQRLQTPALCRCVVDDAPKRPPAETSNEAPSPPLVNTDSLRQGSGSLGFRKHDDTEPVLGDVPGPLELGRPSVRPGSPPGPGHKFPLPALPLPSKMHVKHRYDPILVQLTRLLMKDGKLSKAQRVRKLSGFWAID
jgi:hypothetical protein